MIKTIIFDIDSTLVTIEGLLELARHKGFNHEIEEITRLGNEGKISFNESLSRRLACIKPSLNDLEWLSDYYVNHVTPYTQDVLAELAMLGVQPYFISGSFRQALKGLQELFDTDKTQWFANELIFDEHGRYDHIDIGQPLAQNGGKLEIIKQIKPERSVIMVGDGMTDFETDAYVDIFVGFGGVVEREIVKEKADQYIYDLRDIISMVKEVNGN